MSVRIHCLAFIDDTVIYGDGTVIWQFASILRGVRIGKNCSIGAGTEIGAGTIIGDNCRISAQVFLPSNSRIGNNVFIGPGAKFADDKYPRANNPNYFAQPPVIEDNAAIGMGAIILPGIKIGEHATVAAGAIVTKSIPNGGHFRGEAAKSVEPPKIHHEEYQELVAPSVIQQFKGNGK